jgi:hypothetical protein
MTDTDEEQRQLWGPDRRRNIDGTIDEVVEAYSLLLEVCYKDLLKPFQERLRNAPDAARAEAVVFSWLRSQQFSPIPAETASSGGVDCLCMPDSGDQFIVEVTSLKRNAVELRSGWPDELNDRAASFGMITPNLWSKARHKTAQLAGNDVARILAICLAHVGASALLGPLAAEWLMTSEPKISMPIGAHKGQTRQVTDLRKSAFIAVQDGNIVPVRRSISAILLIAIWRDRLEVVGMLHPAPAVAFDYRYLGDLPFLRINWPLSDGPISTEWVVGHASPREFYYRPVSITDAELRGK